MAAPEHSAKTCYNDGLQLPVTNHCADAGMQFCAQYRCHRLRAGLSEGRIRVAMLNTSHPTTPSLPGSGKALHSWHSGSPPISTSPKHPLSTPATCPRIHGDLQSCCPVTGVTLKQAREKIVPPVPHPRLHWHRLSTEHDTDHHACHNIT